MKPGGITFQDGWIVPPEKSGTSIKALLTSKAQGIRVIYYMPPQLWAWGSWRIHRVRKYVDLVLSGLTFETDWYAERKIPVMYVGHPFFDDLAEHRPEPARVEKLKNPKGPTVAILPGSRSFEIRNNTDVLLSAVPEPGTVEAKRIVIVRVLDGRMNIRREISP